jgi:hypothetical protein
MNQPFEFPGSEGLDNLLRAEVGRVEVRWIFVAVAPLAVRKRVRRKVDEAVEFEFMPGRLRP